MSLNISSPCLRWYLSAFLNQYLQSPKVFYPHFCITLWEALQVILFCGSINSPLHRQTPHFTVGLLPIPPPWSTPLSATWLTARARWCTIRETVAMMTTTPRTRNRKSQCLVTQPRVWLSAAPCLPGAIALRPMEPHRYLKLQLERRDYKKVWEILE